MNTATSHASSSSAPLATRGRVLVAKLGLDGHDVGAKFVSRLLRDSGFEVVYLGIRQSPEAVVRAAIDEDVDVVGLSMLSGSHGVLVGRVVELLAAEGATDLPVVLGGVIPAADRAHLESLGVAAIFDAGVPPEVLVRRISELACGVR